MSYEETLVCDGCSTVISGGNRDEMNGQLLDDGGRIFDWTERDGRIVWFETRAVHRARRHLCKHCAGDAKFFDGEPVPDRTEAA